MYQYVCYVCMYVCMYVNVNTGFRGGNSQDRDQRTVGQFGSLDHLQLVLKSPTIQLLLERRKQLSLFLVVVVGIPLLLLYSLLGIVLQNSIIVLSASVCSYLYCSHHDEFVSTTQVSTLIKVYNEMNASWCVKY